MLFLSAWAVPFLYSQSMADRWNMHFDYGDSVDFKWWIGNNLLMKRDSTELVNGKYPLLIGQLPSKHELLPKVPLSVIMYQEFPISVNCEDSVQVVLHSKSRNLKTCMVKGICIDDRENVVRQDSIVVEHQNWDSDTLIISLKNTTRLILGIFALGNEGKWKQDEQFRVLEQDSQELWLDKMEVISADQDYFSDVTVEGIDDVLSDSCITPLDKNNLYQNLPIPVGKKIVALGESVHGSNSIKNFHYEYLKKLVTKNKCRLIILEVPIDYTPYLNLFIQGKLPEEEKQYIAEELQANHVGFLGEDFIDFLLWLRRFNLNTYGDKVYISGNVGPAYGKLNRTFWNPLYEYIAAYHKGLIIRKDISLSKETVSKMVSPILESLKEQTKLEDVQMYMSRNERQLRSIMGSIDYDLFSYILALTIDYVDIDKDKVFESKVRRFLSRDHTMFLNSQWFIGKCLTGDNTVAVVAHCGHTDKKNYIFGFPYIYPMGYYFREYYGDSYFNIAFTVGIGEIISLADLAVAHLDYPLKGSFESQCMEKKLPYLYYRNCIHGALRTSYRVVGNKYWTPELYVKGDISQRIDAFVFIRESIVPLKQQLIIQKIKEK